MKYIIFYSWQSDLPNNTNRGFLENVIRKAIDDTNRNENYELEPSLDRDTEGIPGAPNITQTILNKIKTCDAFVADISIVTGNKNENKRLSPNPNVLLELGYAIALLGWDKIILFYNNIYGNDEDLPFDIRQHRRITYNLKQDDNKTLVKTELANHFKKRLLELLDIGKASLNKKQPIITAKWDYTSFLDHYEKGKGIISDTLVLKRMIDILDLDDEVKKEIAFIQNIDGKIDTDWTYKINAYIDNENEFLDNLKDEIKKQNYLISANSDKVKAFTISAENEGTMTATDIRINIAIPDWLLVISKFPDEKDIPQRPKKPKPEKKIPLIFPGNGTVIGHKINSNFNFPQISEKYSGCYIKDGYINFWADRILHKHYLENSDDTLYLMAKPNAPTGDHFLNAKAFCSEYDDWLDIKISINIS